MKTRLHSRQSQRAYALTMTMAMLALSLIILSSEMAWVSENSRSTERQNEYLTTLAAAEAATEKVVTAISRDYYADGEANVYSRLSTYASSPLTAADHSYWGNFQFKNPQGQQNGVYVTRLSPTNYVNLDTKYTGLMGIAATYRIIANAKNLNSKFNVVAAVGQDVQVASIPLFQFAIFYGPDMEINPGATMMVNGRVHCNADTYLQPANPLTFMGDVTSVGAIYLDKKPGDPTVRTASTVTFKKENDGGVSFLNLPIGTNNSPDAIRGVIEVPPTSESPTSPMGSQRYYNKADLIVLVSNTTVTAKSGVGFSPITLTNGEWSIFVQTNITFFNKRENLDIQATQIDISKLRTWSQTNNTLRPALGGRDVNTIYVADLRDVTYTAFTTNYLYTTNYIFITNTIPTASANYPSNGTYLGSVSPTSVATNSPTLPAIPPAFNVTTNTSIATTVAFPAGGTYLGTVTTNTANTNSASPPGAGTYVGAVTTNWVQRTNRNNPPSPGTYIPGSLYQSNGKWNYKEITGYSYAKITGYRYNKIASYGYSLPGYIYNRILGYTTNSTVTTNQFTVTNTVVFAESGVRLINGRILPSAGLTVATPNPLYIKGDYNISRNGINFFPSTTNTANTLPASVIADSITLLSTNWNDANSGNSLGGRIAGHTTFNTAILAGIVPTTTNRYSGGVENLPRFLEDWSGRTNFYNGSMVVLYDSRIAIAPWGGNDVYSPPSRRWTFDNNFMDTTKLPPGTPQVQTLIRGEWRKTAPGSTFL